MSKSVFELNKFENVFLEKQRELDNALKEERLADIKVAELKKEIEVFTKHLEELKQRIKKTEEIRDKLGYISKLEDWLSGDFSSLVSLIEKNVMIKLKGDFSKLFAKWFLMLVSDAFNVWLDDDFTPQIELISLQAHSWKTSYCRN